MRYWLGLTLLLLPAACQEGAQVPQGDFVPMVTNGRTSYDANNDGFADLLVTQATARAPCNHSLFYGSASGLDLADPVTGGSHECYGATLARAGDLDDDGYADAVASAGFAGSPSDPQVWLGAERGFAQAGLSLTDLTRPSERTEDYGCISGRAGDVNGDGIDDLWVVRPNYNFSLHLGAAGWDNPEPQYTNNVEFVPEDEAIMPARGVARAQALGDLDNDGYDDLAVMISGESTWIAWGAPEGLARGGYDEDLNGYWLRGVAGAGDFNGDGLDDLLFEDDVVTDATAFHVLYGLPGASVFDGARHSVSIPPDDGHAHNFANHVGLAGDINADGYDDVLWWHNKVPDGIDSMLYQGRLIYGVHVFYGTADGVMEQPASVIEPPQRLIDNAEGAVDHGFRWGTVVGSAGDVNGDGYGDIAIYQVDGIGIHFGSAQGPSTSPDQWVQIDYIAPTFAR